MAVPRLPKKSAASRRYKSRLRALAGVTLFFLSLRYFGFLNSSSSSSNLKDPPKRNHDSGPEPGNLAAAVQQPGNPITQATGQQHQNQQQQQRKQPRQQQRKQPRQQQQQQQQPLSQAGHLVSPDPEPADGGLRAHSSSSSSLKDPPLDWVAPFFKDFSFSLQPSDACQKALQNAELWAGISSADPEDERAQSDWMLAMNACHGPLPESDRDAMEELSLKHFWNQLKACPSSEEGSCLEKWAEAVQGKSGKDLQELFVDIARCALLTEFPLKPKVSYDEPTPMKAKKPKGWKPKRVVLLAMSNQGESATVACKIVSTALTRGWNLTLVEGPQTELRRTFSDALAALSGLLTELASNNIAAEDTVVVFGDAQNMLVQQSPKSVLKKYMDQPYEFLFGAAETCHPMGHFPHSIAAKDYVCEHLFPFADAWGIRMGTQYVNTGGWIATANTAAVVLREIVQFMQRYAETQAHCLEWGSEEVLGSMAFLRHRDLIGLDVNYEIFSGGSSGLIDKELTLQAQNRTQAYCHHEYHDCPGMLHFNGRVSNAGTLDSVFGVLTSEKAIQKCPSKRWGALTVVTRIEDTVETVYKDVHLQKDDYPEWNKCLAGKACYGK